MGVGVFAVIANPKIELWLCRWTNNQKIIGSTLSVKKIAVNSNF
jgi:hypothetical protein